MWSYTPRQTFAYLKLKQKRRRRELAQMLMLNALAAQGDADGIKKQYHDLLKD